MHSIVGLILFRYLDNEAEAKAQEAEVKAQLIKTKKAEEVCIAYESHYDVVTNEPKTIAKPHLAEQARLDELERKAYACLFISCD